MRGAVGVLLVAALWCAPVAQAQLMLDAPSGASADVYVCVDPSPADPKIWFSSTDCASGTHDLAVIVVSESATGTEVIVHVRACLEDGCAPSVCVNGACKPECPAEGLCGEHACRLSTCPLPW